MNEIKIDFPVISAPPKERTRLVPLRQPTSPEEQATMTQRMVELNDHAAMDNHITLAPTHLVMKGERVVGYASMGGLPTLNVWMDSQRTHAMDSVRMLEHAEVALREKGVRHFLMPCAENSPFAPHMERLGFRRLGPTVLYIKEV